MPDKQIVINTSPIIALFSAFDDLGFLKNLYSKIIVPLEVKEELLFDNEKYLAASLLNKSGVFTVLEESQNIMPFLLKSLDIGEASVIQTALVRNIDTVCVDEISGRRIARLSDLKVTGSLGIVIKAIKQGQNIDLVRVINRMKSNGIWINEVLEKEAIRLLTIENQ